MSDYLGERRTFIEMLNRDCEPELLSMLGQAEAGEPIEDPCLLCGFSLEGHKYVFRAHLDEPLRGKTDGNVHLSCLSVIRGAQNQRLEARLAELKAENERLRLVLVGRTCRQCKARLEEADAA